MSDDENTVVEEDDWEDEVEEQPPERCPACGDNRFGPYLWGLVQPPLSEELVDHLGREQVRFTGCCIDDETPRWFCQSCDADIGEDGRLIQAVSEPS